MFINKDVCRNINCGGDQEFSNNFNEILNIDEQKLNYHSNSQ